MLKDCNMMLTLPFGKKANCCLGYHTLCILGLHMPLYGKYGKRYLKIGQVQWWSGVFVFFNVYFFVFHKIVNQFEFVNQRISQNLPWPSIKNRIVDFTDWSVLFVCLLVLIYIICICMTKEEYVSQKIFYLGPTKCQHLFPYRLPVFSGLHVFNNGSLNSFPYKVVEVTHMTLNTLLCHYYLKSWWTASCAENSYLRRNKISVLNSSEFPLAFSFQNSPEQGISIPKTRETI